MTSDEDLLTDPDPRAFGEFYARHLAGVERYFTRRVGDPEAAADLAAETFAAALVARRRFRPGPVPAAGWLYAIAARRLADRRRRGGAEARARARLARERSPLAEPDTGAAGLLRHLSLEQRQAIAGRVLEGCSYGELAAAAGQSEASVRQRVSRGLAGLRAPLRVYRAARDLAGEDRAYRFGGGHGVALAAVGRRDALDCSAALSLVLARAGLFAPAQAWPSGRFATDWGEPGEGRYVTLWATEGHVWLEFRLDADQGERFDPTPVRLAAGSGWLRTRPGPKHDLVPRHCPGL